MADVVLPWAWKLCRAEERSCRNCCGVTPSDWSSWAKADCWLAGSVRVAVDWVEALDDVTAVLDVAVVVDVLEVEDGLRKFSMAVWIT